MPLILSPLMADRFARVFAVLFGLIGDHALRGRREDRIAGLIQAYFHRIGQRFLARATTPPHPREGISRGPRIAAPGTPSTPRARPAPPPASGETPADGFRRPRGPAWLVKIIQPTTLAFSHLQVLLREPEVIALLAARPYLLRLLAPLYNAMACPPEPRIGVPRPRKPAPDPDTTDPDATDPDATGAQANPPRAPRRRKRR